jgi:hypothetical protein
MDELNSTPVAPDPREGPAAELPVLNADAAIPVTTEPTSVADLPIIQTEPTPTVVTTPEPQVVEKIVEKEVIKEVVKEVPVDRVVEKIVEKPVEVIKEIPVEKVVEKEVVKEVPVEKIVEHIVEKPVEVIKEVPVEKIVYKEAEPTDASLRAYLANFLRRVGPKGRAAQHERAQKKRDAALKLFDTHEHVTHKLVMETLKFTDRDASRILATLRSEGKIVLHEPSASHHGGKGTFYSRSTSATK